MLQERLPKQALLAKVKGKRLVERPPTRWQDYIEDLGWNRFSASTKRNVGGGGEP